MKWIIPFIDIWIFRAQKIGMIFSSQERIDCWFHEIRTFHFDQWRFPPIFRQRRFVPLVDRPLDSLIAERGIVPSSLVAFCIGTFPWSQCVYFLRSNEGTLASRFYFRGFPSHLLFQAGLRHWSLSLQVALGRFGMRTKISHCGSKTFRRFFCRAWSHNYNATTSTNDCGFS